MLMDQELAECVKHTSQLDGSEALETCAMYIIQKYTISGNETLSESEVLLHVVLCSCAERKITPFTLHVLFTLFHNQEKSATRHRFTAVHP